MANKLNGGIKEHLIGYSGVKIINGVVRLSLSKLSRGESACGKRADGSNAIVFSSYVANHPTQVCQNCVASLKKLMLEADKLKALI